MLKRTAFYQKHIEAGGKIVPFSGFELPIQYRSIVNEVKKVRTDVGLFDVSHMGRIEIIGDKVLNFISKITTNDPAKLEEGQIQYSCMCYQEGGIVDDILVYRLKDKWLLVVNAGNKSKDYDWMKANNEENVEIIDVSDKVAQLAIQGPKAENVIQELVNISLRDFQPLQDFQDLSELKYYWSTNCKIATIDTLISRTGYTGEDGFELYFPTKYGADMWTHILDAGAKFGLEPIGLGARDTLRLEMKYCLYGNDIDETTTPLEAGLGWITKLDKNDFIGKQAIVNKKTNGVKRKLAAFIMENKVIPRQHYKIYKQGETSSIGEVTSGNYSPSIERSIGLGYVNIPYNEVDNEIEIECKSGMEKAKIVSPPFYKQGSRK